MSWEVIIKPLAEKDIDEAFLWYERAHDNLGFEFLLSLEAVFESLIRNPFFAGYLYKEIRSASLSRFPFEVIYTVEGNRIVVIGVLHHSRSPSEWIKRSD